MRTDTDKFPKNYINRRGGKVTDTDLDGIGMKVIIRSSVNSVNGIGKLRN